LDHFIVGTAFFSLIEELKPELKRDILWVGWALDPLVFTCAAAYTQTFFCSKQPTHNLVSVQTLIDWLTYFHFEILLVAWLAWLLALRTLTIDFTLPTRLNLCASSLCVNNPL
jgi:hypothetical protein